MTDFAAALSDPARLGELRALAILDTPPERDYDDIAAEAARVTGRPVAAINFVDEDRHFTKAVAGMPDALGASLDHEASLCATTVAEPDGLLVVEDLATDPRFAGHPAAAGGVGSYVGAAIVSRGERVGVVCAFGPEPREITAAEREHLAVLADQVAAQLRLRRRSAA